MKKVTRDPNARFLITGNSIWDAVLAHYTVSFPRLMAHVSRVGLGSQTKLFVPPTPTSEPFGILTLRTGVPTKFDAVEDLATTLVLLARYLRYHARTEASPSAPVLPPPTDAWGSPTVH